MIRLSDMIVYASYPVYVASRGEGIYWDIIIVFSRVPSRSVRRRRYIFGVVYNYEYSFSAPLLKMTPLSVRGMCGGSRDSRELFQPPVTAVGLRGILRVVLVNQVPGNAKRR